MYFSTVLRILGILMMLFSLTLLPPIFVSWLYEDGVLHAFGLAFVIILAVGIASWLPVKHIKREMRLRDGFIVVIMFWTVLSATGALPFILAEKPHLSVTDAVFESVSGLTTTGATVITDLDNEPKAILYYRQQLQWLGGMGIVVLAVAVLPMLGIGGMQMYRAETPGPVKDSKLTPRITETAKALWYLYLVLTIACGLAYWAAGMSGFDAICHAFSTIAIGGFSTHDASLGYFDSDLINLIAVFFMFAAGINFALHFIAWRDRSLLGYLRDSEMTFYAAILIGVSILTIIALLATDTYEHPWDAFVQGLFHAVSIGTTSGFATTEFFVWPDFVAILLLLTSFVGGCAGSTGGGIKVIRFLLLIKQGMREIKRLVHPNALIPIRLGDKSVQPRVVEAVWGFFALYVASYVVMYLGLLASGVEMVTAFSAVAAAINNLGPGLGEVGAHYAELNNSAKWILAVAMLLGRLEIFTLLVVLSPAFWRH